MSYGGTLVMPKSYAVMDQEEMCYVEGGAKWSVNWKVSSVRRTVNVISWFIGVALWKFGTVGALIRFAGKNKAIKVWTELAKYFGLTSSHAKVVGGFVNALTGISIGDAVAYALNYYDHDSNDDWIRYR